VTDEFIQHLPRLRRYARALTRNADDADDLVQDTLERAWSRVRLFRVGTRLDHWLLSIMHNLHVNTVRRQVTRPSMQPFSDEFAPVSEDPSDGRLDIRDLDRALAQLPDEQRAALLLVGLEDCSYREAADILGIPVGTVMSRLSRARDRLRQLLAGPPVNVAAPTPRLRVVR
jgi:RNA polymerase sigma-70 factor (ECF subfamily)